MLENGGEEEMFLPGFRQLRNSLPVPYEVCKAIGVRGVALLTTAAYPHFLLDLLCGSIGVFLRLIYTAGTSTHWDMPRCFHLKGQRADKGADSHGWHLSTSLTNALYVGLRSLGK